MPVLYDMHCPSLASATLPSTEILQRRSINSLLGLGMPDPPPAGGADTSQQYAFSQQPDEYPNSPESGQTPRSILPQYFPPRNVSAYASYSEIGSGIDQIIGTNSGPYSNLSSAESDYTHYSPSPPMPNMDNSISELMNCLAMLPEPSQKYQTSPDTNSSKYNGYSDDNDSRRNSMTYFECLGPPRWSGTLPTRPRRPPSALSQKVFLGGLPWDVTETTLMHTFKHFHPICVEWPGKEHSSAQPKGYIYMVFDSEQNVQALLAASSYEAGNWYYRISSKKMRSKEVQVIPWMLEDSNYVKNSSVRLDPARTVFVGALHGVLAADGLAKVMDDLFKGVVYAGIDTDKHKYPIGSGRVTFNNMRSYLRAVSAAFVDIKTDKFQKRVQVDPYLEDSMCSTCQLQQGPYFCRETSCFRYFCRPCWQWQHAKEPHKPLMRNSRSSGGNNGYRNSGNPITPTSSSGCNCSPNNSPQPSYSGNNSPQSTYNGNNSPQSTYNGNNSPQSTYNGNNSPQPTYSGNNSPQLSYGGNASPQSSCGGSHVPQNYCGSHTSCCSQASSSPPRCSNYIARTNSNSSSPRFRKNFHLWNSPKKY